MVRSLLSITDTLSNDFKAFEEQALDPTKDFINVKENRVTIITGANQMVFWP